jgi:CDP-diacylglycerol--glycerol-3-phosphate 3-phosphatidyltransferase
MTEAGKMRIMKNLPNRITISRMVIIFIFIFFANVDANKINFIIPITQEMAHVSHVIAYILAIIAGFSDLLDGYLARKYGCVSDFGKLMDPLADKIFMVATLITMTTTGLSGVDGRRDIVAKFLVTGLRMLATSRGQVIAADKGGKIKTFLQMIALLSAAPAG